MATNPKICIFGSSHGKVTREHVFANWLKAHIPPIHVRHQPIEYTERKKGELWFPQLTRGVHRTGNPYNWTVSCVCKKCNNEWMSVLQERAKPVIVPLLLGKPTSLDIASQITLSAWVAMATIVAEFDPRNSTIAIHERDRDWLYKHHTAPSSFRIWIGQYADQNSKGFYWHTTMPISSPEDVPEGENPDLPRSHTQTTTFIVGQLYVHVLSSSVPAVVSKLRLNGRAPSLLTQVWPSIHQSITWPPGTRLVDTDTDGIAVALFDYLRRIPPPTKQ